MKTTTWYEGKVRYEKVNEAGLNTRVTESYLVDAMSFTEAESRLIEQVGAYMRGEYDLSGIRRAHLAEVIHSHDADADRWYRCKLYLITLDERTGGEKKTAVQMLVQGRDLRTALDSLDAHMSGTLADYQVASVSESPILDVFVYAPITGAAQEGGEQ